MNRHLISRRIVPRQGALRIPPGWKTGTTAERIHHRATSTGHSQFRAAVNSTEHSVRRLIWTSLLGQRAIDSLSPRWAEKYASHTGIGAPEQRRLLTTLAREKGISPVDAYWFDLVNPARSPLWPNYVYSSERHWNLAASEVILGSRSAAKEAIAFVQDKWATNHLLRSLGIAVPDTVSLPAERVIASHDLLKWFDSWGDLYAKPRAGSGGRGALLIEQSPSSEDVRINGTPTAIETATSRLNQLMLGTDYLIQPKLRTPNHLNAADVVTVRVVTRLINDTPHVFSSVLEWPSRFGPNHEIFALSQEGLVEDPVIPLWIPGYDVTRSSRPITEIADLPDIERAALSAHERLGGVFAVAWDIALSEEGPLFLEGNCGFGLNVPQVNKGGILP